MIRRLLSVNRSGLDELEEGGFGFELGSIRALHFESACHRPKGRWQWAARSIFERLSWLEDRLLANDPGPVDLLGMARAVHDRPMPVQQLNGRIAYIRNANRVEEEPAAGGRAAVLRRITRTDLDPNAPGFGFGTRLEEIAFGHARDASRQGPFDGKASRQ